MGRSPASCINDIGMLTIQGFFPFGFLGILVEYAGKPGGKARQRGGSGLHNSERHTFPGTLFEVIGYHLRGGDRPATIILWCFYALCLTTFDNRLFGFILSAPVPLRKPQSPKATGAGIGFIFNYVLNLGRCQDSPLFSVSAGIFQPRPVDWQCPHFLQNTATGRRTAAIPKLIDRGLIPFSRSLSACACIASAFRSDTFFPSR